MFNNVEVSIASEPEKTILKINLANEDGECIFNYNFGVIMDAFIDFRRYEKV